MLTNKTKGSLAVSMADIDPNQASDDSRHLYVRLHELKSQIVQLELQIKLLEKTQKQGKQEKEKTDPIPDETKEKVPVKLLKEDQDDNDAYCYRCQMRTLEHSCHCLDRDVDPKCFCGSSLNKVRAYYDMPNIKPSDLVDYTKIDAWCQCTPSHRVPFKLHYALVCIGQHDNSPVALFHQVCDITTLRYPRIFYEKTGPDHFPTYMASIKVSGRSIKGWGPTKRAAEEMVIIRLVSELIEHGVILVGIEKNPGPHAPSDPQPIVKRDKDSTYSRALSTWYTISPDEYTTWTIYDPVNYGTQYIYVDVHAVVTTGAYVFCVYLQRHNAGAVSIPLPDPELGLRPFTIPNSPDYKSLLFIHMGSILTRPYSSRIGPILAETDSALMVAWKSQTTCSGTLMFGVSSDDQVALIPQPQLRPKIEHKVTAGIDPVSIEMVIDTLADIYYAGTLSKGVYYLNLLSKAYMATSFLQSTYLAGKWMFSFVKSGDPAPSLSNITGVWPAIKGIIDNVEVRQGVSDFMTEQVLEILEDSDFYVQTVAALGSNGQGRVNTTFSVVPQATAGPTDVRVVGFGDQVNPLWVSNVNNGPIFGTGMVLSRTQRNHDMHALNGNTMLSAEEVKAFDTMFPQYEGLGPVQDVYRQIDSKDIETALTDLFQGKTGQKEALFYTFFRRNLHSNRFAALGFVPEDLGSSLDDIDAPDTISKHQSRVVSMRRDTDEKRPKKKKEDAAPAEPVVKKLSPYEAMEKYRRVVDRVVDKLKKGGEDAVVAWLIGKPKSRFAEKVLHAYFGASWDACSGWLSWWASFRIYPMKDDRLEVTGLARYNDSLAKLAKSQAWAKWFEEKYQFSWSESVSVFETEADAHNRTMHAYNGNPWALSMSDVRAAPGMDLYKTPLTTENAKPWDLQTELSSLSSSMNPMYGDIPLQTLFHGDVVRSNNNIVAGRVLNPPETMLYPRQMRHVGVAPIFNSASEMTSFVVDPISYAAGTLEETELVRTIMESAIKANQNLARADNVALNGFLAIDIASIGRLKSFYGFSAEAILARLLLLYSVKAWGGSISTLPVAGELSAYCAATVIDASQGQTLGVNDSPVFNEACGGNASLLPFRGGATGDVFFHLSIDTVPRDERAMAVFCPMNLICSDAHPAKSLALFVAMWADWPTALHTVQFHTLDENWAQPGTQKFMPFASTVHVPGMTRIHVILPRRGTHRNPTSQVDANTITAITPKCGPTPSAAYGAGFLININYVGGALYGVNLAQYMYTWLMAIDTTDITIFIQRINDIVDIKQTVKYIFERMSTWIVRYPAMIATPKDNSAYFVEDSVPARTQITPLGTGVFTPGVMWPQPIVSRSDSSITQTDLIAWNKVVLGLATVSGYPATGAAITPMLGNPNTQYWLKLMARRYAVTTCVHLANIGWTTEIWNSAYTLTDMSIFRIIASAHYTTTMVGQLKPAGAQYGGRLAKLYTGLNGGSPVCDIHGKTAFDYIHPPQEPRHVLFDDANNELTNTVPVFLADVWIHQTTKVINSGFMPFPPQNNSDSAVGMTGDDWSVVVTGGGYGPMVRPETVRVAYGQMQTRDDVEGEKWNVRLAAALLSCAGLNFAFRRLDGTLVAGGVPAGSVVKQQILYPDNYTYPNLITGVETSSSLWYPRMTPTGEAQFLIASRADMTTVNKVLNGLTRGSVTIWAVNGIKPSSDFKLGMDKHKSVWIDMLKEEGDVVNQGGAKPEVTAAVAPGKAPGS